MAYVSAAVREISGLRNDNITKFHIFGRRASEGRALAEAEQKAQVWKVGILQLQSNHQVRSMLTSTCPQNHHSHIIGMTRGRAAGRGGCTGIHQMMMGWQSLCR